MSEVQDISPLFQNDNDEDNAVTAELFRDRVRCLHEYFDKNGDGFLNFEELAALQKATEGATLTKEMYVMACKALDSKPDRGISVDALKLTYASEGTDVNKDYYKVFPEKKPKEEPKGEDYVYEAGKDGFDIS